MFECGNYVVVRKFDVDDVVVLVFVGVFFEFEM